MIQDAKIKQLKPITDERGFLMEILRKDDEIFKEFGQAYITAAKPGFVKAWHYHKLQTDNFTCLKGKVKVVLYDPRENSKTKGDVQEFFLSLETPIVLQIPPFVYHGFECVSDEESIILNIPTKPYNRETPDEHRVNPFDNDIPYEWSSKKGW